MINNSRLEYIFIRTCILALHYFTPLCILYTLLLIYLHGLKATHYPIPLAVELLALAESLFYLLVFLPYRAYLQRSAVHPDALSRPDRRALFEKCNANIADPELYLEKWFLGAPPEEIKRDNFKEFILWAFFNRGGEPGDDDEELEEYVRMYEELLGRKFEEGRGKAACLRLTLEKVDMLHRSLAWYFVRISPIPHSDANPNLTSASASSTSSPTPASSSPASTSTARLSRAPWPSSLSVPRPFSRATVHPHNTRPTGTVHTPHARTSPSSSSTASASDSTRT